MTSKPPPQIPAGSGSIFSGMTENLSFHSSPESFLVARILQHHKDNPDQVLERAAVRAKILNRNVIIISAYDQARHVLGAEESTNGDRPPPFVAVEPYRQLMEAFFPPPNLLLSDGCPHRQMRTRWDGKDLFKSDYFRTAVGHIASEYLEKLPAGEPIDIYDTMKDLAWKIHLSMFLDLSESDADYAEVVKLHENLLRGQFSLFPVSLNVGLWHSPRKIGIDARKKLQNIIFSRLKGGQSTWMRKAAQSGMPEEELVNHTLMATSSLAVKGWASVASAFLLNLFLYRAEGYEHHSIAEKLKTYSAEDREKRINAVFEETLRLSPPVVGVMRKSTSDQKVPVKQELSPDVLIPKGFDTWCYFVGANRDPTAFGDGPDLFKPERYLHEKQPPLTFGAGAKNCLGKSFVRSAALGLYDAFERSGVTIGGNVDAVGVRGWLGWEVATPEQWARDVKQLPTQRPSKAIPVRLEKSALA